MSSQVKHEVAGVGYVSADNALISSVDVQMQASVAVQGQAHVRSHRLVTQHWPVFRYLLDIALF